MKKPVHNPREVAEIVAVQALSFIAGDPERLGLFLAESGIGPETLRTAAADPQFLASVLDFVLRDDATVKAFASVSQLHPTNIAAARHFGCFLLDGLFFLGGADRPLQGHLAVFRNNLYVVGISGQRLVVHDGLADFLHHVAI